jgi:hypothetical protein
MMTQGATQKARSVYILGAGFSRDYQPTMFPLVHDFLSLARDNKFYVPDGGHRLLAHLIERYFGDVCYHNIEKVLSFLASPSLHDRRILLEERPSRYAELVRIIARFLAEASAGDAVAAETHEVYVRFAHHVVENESVVITFNYDLLLEKLLTATGRWNMNHGYGIYIPSAHDALVSVQNYLIDRHLHQPSDLVRGAATVLKLHGSINWGMPTISADKSETFYLMQTEDFRLLEDFRIRAEHEPLTTYFDPVIVPPVLDKTTWLQNLCFRYIWNMALESLKEARELTFVGYSMAVTDFISEFLFRQAYSTGVKPRVITVVAPDASTNLAKHYQDLFGVERVSFEDMRFAEWVGRGLATV